MTTINEKNLTPLAHGSLWTIYQAESPETGERLWFRVLKQNLSNDQVMVDAFFRSCELSRTIAHPNSLTLREYGSIQSTHYAVYSAFDGIDFETWLQKTKKLLLERALQIMRQIADVSYRYSLAGIPHGALTAKSIFINSDSQVKVVDFGSTELIRHAVHNYSQMLLPLWPYCAPELLTGEYSPTNRSELYAVGVVYKLLLTGALPFTGGNLETILEKKQNPIPSARSGKNVQHGWERLINRMLQPQEEDRLANFLELRTELGMSESPDLTDDEAENHNDQHWFSPLIERFNEPMWIKQVVGSKRRILFLFLALFVFFAVIVGGLLVTEINAPRVDEMTIYEEFVSKLDDEQLPATPVGEMAETDATPAPKTMTTREPARQPSSTPRDGRIAAPAEPLANRQANQPPSSVPQSSEAIKQSGSVLVKFNGTVYADRIRLPGESEPRTLPATAELEPGTYRVVYFSSTGTFRWETQIAVGTNSVSEIAFPADQIKYGQLDISVENAFDFGFVFVSINAGKPLTTPAHVELPVGHHHLKFQRPGYLCFPSDTVIAVLSGQRNTISCRLEPVNDTDESN